MRPHAGRMGARQRQRFREGGENKQEGYAQRLSFDLAPYPFIVSGEVLPQKFACKYV